MVVLVSEAIKQYGIKNRKTNCIAQVVEFLVEKDEGTAQTLADLVGLV